jgi:hypothetical protein
MRKSVSRSIPLPPLHINIYLLRVSSKRGGVCLKMKYESLLMSKIYSKKSNSNDIYDKREYVFTVGEPSDKTFLFSEETINSLGELGGILKRIHKRLVSEGYEIKDGEFKEKFDIM